jgi:hypothetical protein
MKLVQRWSMFGLVALDDLVRRYHPIHTRNTHDHRLPLAAEVTTFASSCLPILSLSLSHHHPKGFVHCKDPSMNLLMLRIALTHTTLSSELRIVHMDAVSNIEVKIVVRMKKKEHTTFPILTACDGMVGWSDGWSDGPHPHSGSPKRNLITKELV